MRLFQFVEDRTAEVILNGGFEDLPFQRHTQDGQTIKGVWLFDSPNAWQKEFSGVAVDVGKVMLAVEVQENALTGHEIMVMDDELEVREFLVPASLVNSFSPPKITDVDLNWPELLDDIYTDDLDVDLE